MSYWEFSSENLPATERDNAFRHVYSTIANMDIQPRLGPSPLIKVNSQILPDLNAHKVTMSPHSSQRTHSQAAKESSDLMSLIIPIDGRVNVTLGKDTTISCMPGDGLLMPNDAVYQVQTSETLSIAVTTVPIKLIYPRVKDLESCFLKRITRESTPELSLLLNYATLLAQLKNKLSQTTTSVTAQHIYDLITLIAGSRIEESMLAKQRGAKAARFKLIKQDIDNHITDNDLSISQVAFRNGVSPQYIRSMFHDLETKFSDYVNEIRLQLAYTQLCNSSYNHLSISELALNVGFDNLSWFNRLFKKRFGLSPSEVRVHQIYLL